MSYLLIISLLLLTTILLSGIRIMKEFERGVIFTLGRFSRVTGPGIIYVIPILQQMTRVDLRIIVMDVPPQDVISRDNISVQVNAVLYFYVMNPDKAIINVEDFFSATSQLAQTTLRSVLGQHDLDDMLAEREKLNQHIQSIVDEQTDHWGIKVSNVEIKHIDLNEGMIRVIAKQAEAERARRAKVIHAEGEYQAAEKLVKAAEMLTKNPQALQLRYLQTLNSIAEEKNSTIVFPFPMELLSSFQGILDKFINKESE
tara:strand:- start:67 stop:837 length:771 start_codon:yes stop_codon:yes gene_type:complete